MPVGAGEQVWTVAVNALIGGVDRSEARRAALAAVQAGYRVLKIKVGVADPMIDVSRVRAARAVVGNEVELRLDANGAWDEATAIEALNRLEDCDIAFCEEPVAGVDAIAALSRKVAVPLAVDESLQSEADAAKALAQGVPVIVIKPQALGGADIALSIAEQARSVGARVVVTSLIDSAVGLSHALHTAVVVDALAANASAVVVDALAANASAVMADALAAQTGAVRPAHGLATSELLADDVAPAPAVTAGEMTTLRAPGIGLTPTLTPTG